MRRLIALSVGLFFGVMLHAQPVAQVQWIHNAPDPSLDTVDVYVNGSRILNDWTFRSATPLMEVEPGAELNVSVAPHWSSGEEEAWIHFPMSFRAETEYVVTVLGVLEPEAFSNPFRRDISLRLAVQERARTGGQWGEVQFFAVHGAPDMPAFGLRTGRGRLAYDVRYGETTGYFKTQPLILLMSVLSDDEVIGYYLANWQPLNREVVSLHPSGFADPADPAHPAFEMMLVGLDGSVHFLPGALDFYDAASAE